MQPSQATNVLNDRIRLINKINIDVADWLQVRSLSFRPVILNSLASRNSELTGLIFATGATTGRGSIRSGFAKTRESAAARKWGSTWVSAISCYSIGSKLIMMGIRIFQLPWQRIINSTEAVAASHETFAQKIDDDVERPLRDYGNKNRDLASMPVVQNDLAGLAKSLETSQKKVEKAKEKGPKGADKLASAVQTAEEVNQQWDSRAPFVFEQLQAVDEGRLNHLRDVLTQFGTHDADQVERCREAAEACLNSLLNVETADETKTFAAKVNGGRPVVARRQETSPSATPTPTAAPPPLAQDDVASQHSEAPAAPRAPPGEYSSSSAQSSY